MESIKYYSGLKLSAIDFITAEILGICAEYYIETLGQFLGSTDGMRNLSLFSGVRDKDLIIQKLFEFVPEEVVLFYRNFSDKHPMGLIKPENNENTTTDNQ